MCVPLTISYYLFFLRTSKVLSMLHRGSVGWFQSKECYFMSTYTFFTFFSCFLVQKTVFVIFIFFGDEASHFRNTVLTNQKIEWVIRNFHCKCMCNSAVNNIRWVSLPNCQLPRVYLVSSRSNPTDGLNRIFGPNLVTRLQIMCPSVWVTTKPLFW